VWRNHVLDAINVGSIYFPPRGVTSPNFGTRMWCAKKGEPIQNRRCRLGHWLVGSRKHVLDGVKVRRIHSPPQWVTWCDAAYRQNSLTSCCAVLLKLYALHLISAVRCISVVQCWYSVILVMHNTLAASTKRATCLLLLKVFNMLLLYAVLHTVELCNILMLYCEM